MKIGICGEIRLFCGVGTYLEALKGHKHLVIGNHDVKWMINVRLDKYFESVFYMEVIKEGI